MRNCVFDPINNGNGVGVSARFENWYINGALPIYPDDIGLDGGVIGSLSYIRHEHGVAVYDFERHLVYFLNIT